VVKLAIHWLFNPIEESLDCVNCLWRLYKCLFCYQKLYFLPQNTSKQWTNVLLWAYFACTNANSQR